MFALALLLLAALANAGELVVDVLDVGQGDAILIRTPAQKTILIDAGDKGSGVVEQMTRLGVDHLDMVVATHPHADHIGSMEAVVRALPPKVYLDNGLSHTTQTYASLMTAVEANPAIAYKTAQRGQVFNLDDGARLEVLFPDTSQPFRGTRSDLNSNSVVLRLVHGDDCFLFPGDAEEPTERALIEAQMGACDVLKVAHHGGRHSTIEPMLAMVKPSIAVISVGIGNRYKHPGDETLARLDAAKATVYRTDRDGRVTLLSDGTRIRVETSRHEAPGGVLIPVSGLPGHDATGAASPPKPTAAEPGLTPDLIDPEACPFPASRNSKVYHDPHCANAHKINAENLTCFDDAASAVASGRRPAGCCHPEAPAPEAAPAPAKP